MLSTIAKHQNQNCDALWLNSVALCLHKVKLQTGNRYDCVAGGREGKRAVFWTLFTSFSKWSRILCTNTRPSQWPLPDPAKTILLSQTTHISKTFHTNKKEGHAETNQWVSLKTATNNCQFGKLYVVPRKKKNYFISILTPFLDR